MGSLAAWSLVGNRYRADIPARKASADWLGEAIPARPALTLTMSTHFKKDAPRVRGHEADAPERRKVDGRCLCHACIVGNICNAWAGKAAHVVVNAAPAHERERPPKSWRLSYAARKAGVPIGRVLGHVPTRLHEGTYERRAREYRLRLRFTSSKHGPKIGGNDRARTLRPEIGQRIREGVREREREEEIADAPEVEAEIKATNDMLADYEAGGFLRIHAEEAATDIAKAMLARSRVEMGIDDVTICRRCYLRDGNAEADARGRRYCAPCWDVKRKRLAAR